MTDLLFDPRIWLGILLLAVVEISVNLAKYYVGRQGTAAIHKRFPNTGPERWEQINGWFQRAGPPVLMLMAIPVVSTLLAVAAGIRGLRIYTFVGWDLIAIVSRYWMIVLVIYVGYQWLA